MLVSVSVQACFLRIIGFVFLRTSKYVRALQRKIQFIIYGAHANENEITFLLDLLIEFDLTLNLK